MDGMLKSGEMSYLFRGYLLLLLSRQRHTLIGIPPERLFGIRRIFILSEIGVACLDGGIVAHVKGRIASRVSSFLYAPRAR